MFQVPVSVLETLICSICEGYLSFKPVMMKEDKQVCGKCYKLLPEKDKNMCMRQISYESLGDMMLFPCKFHKMGCTYTFSWKEPNTHEAECRFKYFTFDKKYFAPEENNNKPVEPPKTQEFACENDLIKAHVNYQIKENKYDKEFKNLTYQLNIQGAFGKMITIKDVFYDKEQQDVAISLEGAVSLRYSPEIIYSDIKVQSLSENNVYATIKNDVCVNCNKHRMYENYVSCTLGHRSCVQCKSNACRGCLATLVSTDSLLPCKNFAKGCRERLDQIEAGKHQNNCEYNDIHCPFEECTLVDTLPNLKLHLTENHDNVVFCSNEHTQTYGSKDTTIVMYCYENVFKCVYFYYERFVDFYVTLIGSSEKALDFFFEISVETSKGIITKKCKCCNWHDSMLAQGVNFEKKDIGDFNEKKFAVRTNLRILHFIREHTV